jgi:glutamine synthetase type III
MTHLYELTEQNKELQILAEQGEIDAETLADTMEGIQGSFEEKGIAVIQVAANLDSDIEAIDHEIKRLQARKKSVVNKKEWMREYLRSNMEQSGIDNIKCPLFSITLRKATKQLEITDETKIPADYLDIKTVVSPMKREILAALKTGEYIPGCQLKDSARSLLIK